MHEKIERVKTHIEENKKVYIVAGIAATTGLVVGSLIKGPDLIQIIDAIKIQWKSPTTNNITTVLVRRGHPGYVIKCNETGEIFASIQRASNVLEISRPNLTAHLHGRLSHANGYTFTNLGEAQAS